MANRVRKPSDLIIVHSQLTQIREIAKRVRHRSRQFVVGELKDLQVGERTQRIRNCSRQAVNSVGGAPRVALRLIDIGCVQSYGMT